MARELDVALGGAINTSMRDVLFSRLWGPVNLRNLNLDRYSQPYLAYYNSQCRKFLLDGGRHVSVSSHADIVKIAECMLQGHTRDHLSKVAARLENGQLDADSKDIAASINLCCRLILMMEIGEPLNSLQGPWTVHWNQGSIREFTGQYFMPEVKLEVGSPDLGKLFTASNLRKIGGIEIEWTQNLADHLRLLDDDRRVWVFDCVGFLRVQQRLDRPIFPTGFIDETLCTLSLLFPQNDSKSQHWLRSQMTKHDLDPLLAECGSLRTHERRFDKFNYWHNRLVILKQALDESRPQTMAQWWYDRRNGVQWYTFWVAILVFIFTIFFGVVQSLEGAMQVYLSWKALQQQ